LPIAPARLTAHEERPAITPADGVSAEAFARWRDRVDDWGKARDCQIHNIESWLAALGMRGAAGERPVYCEPVAASASGE